MRTGLLGGSFNPAHGGHRAISRFAMDALQLDEIWWMVSPGNPLKDGAKDMAPLKARLASAQKMARGLPIKATAIEAQLGTRYTVDTLDRIKRRYPKRNFIWLMGADNLANFHLWVRWREIATLMPIAVIARPGYDQAAVTAPAMAWFGRYVRPRTQIYNWVSWSPPALAMLRFRPDPRSATDIRAGNIAWSSNYDGKIVRDCVTRKIIL